MGALQTVSTVSQQLTGFGHKESIKLVMTVAEQESRADQQEE